MRALRWFGARALVVAMAGCTGGNKSGSAPAPSTTVDVALAAQVPGPIRSAGVLIVATDPIYEPSEFKPDAKIVAGFGVDLFNAFAGTLGLKTPCKTVYFADIIAGV